MVNNNNVTRMPSHGAPPLDWTHKEDILSYRRTGFTYIAPTSKYVEAYSLGPVYLSGDAYNIGNQPYAYKLTGYTGRTTPIQPNFLALQKVSPKSSAADIQAAQTRMSQMLASRSSIPWRGLVNG